jgi:hypothetical protein
MVMDGNINFVLGLSHLNLTSAQGKCSAVTGQVVTR